MTIEMCFIRSRADWSMKAVATILDYRLYLDLTGSNTGSVRLQGKIAGVDGDILIIEQRAWLICSYAQSVGDDSTTLQLKPIMNMFDRQLSYVKQGATPEEHICEELLTSFKTCSDAVYAMPYLGAMRTYAPTTAWIEPAVDAYGQYNLLEYIKQVLSVSDMRVWCMVNSSDLTIVVYSRSNLAQYPSERRVDCDGGNGQLISETWSSDAIGKISNSDTTDNTTTDYYLLTDGTITTAYQTVGRTYGKWLHTTDESEDKITQRFCDAAISHDVQFYCAEEFNQGDIVRLRLPDGRVVGTKVSSVQLNLGDSRYRYKCGNLRTTLVEQLQSVMQ